MNSKIRSALQIIILILIVWTIFTAGDIEAYCPMGGILGFGTKLDQGTLPCSMSSAAVFMALALLVGALAIGKLFCSHLCPVGSITEWMGKLGGKIKIQFRLPPLVDRWLRSLKYLLLFFVVYFTVSQSELFCRKFDPYFGAATGFGHDTVLWWSIAAIVVTIVGSLFIKQFWCRYLCFLGAASNIFVNIWGAVGVFALYFILSLLGVKLSLLWLIAGFALVGFLMEAGLFKTIPFPFFKITVDENKCTQCGLCTKACPYDINVDEYKIVTHPDCVMCTECITACQTEKAVRINGSLRLKYLPAILIFVLTGAAFILASSYEFTTLGKRWGKFEQLKRVSVYRQTGLKNVKCFGSSNSLYIYLKTIPGIYGLDTYASSQTVTVYYDTTEISEPEVRQTLFSSRRYRTRHFQNYTPRKLSVWKIGIENLFDPIDQSRLNEALHQNRFVFGIETLYGEPVTVKIYFDADSTNIPEIKNIIEADSYPEIVDGKEKLIDINFRCADEGEIIDDFPVEEFRRIMFEEYNLEFEDYETTDHQEIQILEVGLPRADDPIIYDEFPYLVSSLSAEDGMLRFRTVYADRPAVQIYFDKRKLTPEKIQAVLMADTLTYFVDENTTATTPNIFEFEFPGRVIDFQATGKNSVDVKE